MTNVGLWNDWYADLKRPAPYANTLTYTLGAEWLDGLQVEDWGCGMGWLRTLVPKERYHGIDGSHSRFADEIADLTDYRSETPGLFMRHVLEHNVEYEKVLDNALASFTERMALILFTPLAEETHDLEWEDPPGVPNYSFRLEDLTDRFDGVTWEMKSVSGQVKYGGPETIFYISR